MTIRSLAVFTRETYENWVRNRPFYDMFAGKDNGRDLCYCRGLRLTPQGPPYAGAACEVSSASSTRRSSLPVSVFGNSERNTTDFGVFDDR